MRLSRILFATCVLLLLTSAVASADAPTGSWSGSMKISFSGQDHEESMQMTFKKNGDVEIKAGNGKIEENKYKIKGKTISFFEKGKEVVSWSLDQHSATTMAGPMTIKEDADKMPPGMKVYLSLTKGKATKKEAKPKKKAQPKKKAEPKKKAQPKSKSK